MGVTFVEEVDAWDVDGVNSMLRRGMAHEDGPAVVVVRGACVFTPHFHLQPRMHVDPEACVACGACFRVGCPAIVKSDQLDEKTGRAKAWIDPLLCTGCEICAQVCARKAILYREEMVKEGESA
jgi:indolepyruvate ferredoxin oxidoreductase alpha subunit